MSLAQWNEGKGNPAKQDELAASCPSLEPQNESRVGLRTGESGF